MAPKSIWKSVDQERSQRKWANWSAHFAWGALIVLVASHVVHHAWALVGSISAGLIWEIGYWIVARRIPENRAGAVDWAVWALGATLGLLCVVWL